MGGPKQLDLEIVEAKEIDGLEMGVLEDGTTFLSGRSLAKLCGVAVSTIINQGDRWLEGKRENDLAKFLTAEGFNASSLFLKLKGGAVHAWTDDVCMLVLEHYAFRKDAPSQTAVLNYRKLARASLRATIYLQLGYDPKQVVPEIWRQYHDRMLLNSCPKGYFSVFREMSDLVLTALQRGLRVDAQTIPDISVGKFWSTHWKDVGFETKYGGRQCHPHVYPDYFPQAEAGPVDAWIYPMQALGEFRVWMEEFYLPQKFPNYLNTKVKQGLLPAAARDLILDAVEDKTDADLPPAAPEKKKLGS